MIRRARWVGTIVVALVLSSCGVPTSDDARTVPDHQVPFRLLSPTTSSTTTTQPVAAFVTEPVFLASEAKVVEVHRDVIVPAGLTDVLAALFAGPTTSETSQGITTALPAKLEILDTTTEGTLVTLDLSANFGQITGQAETTAVAQIVLTATSQPGVDQVLFSITGRPISVPTPTGVTTSRPVTAADYRPMVTPTGPPAP